MPDAGTIAAALIARGITVALPRTSRDSHDVAIYLLVADQDPQKDSNGKINTR